LPSSNDINNHDPDAISLFAMRAPIIKFNY
jgi:hypothetical protein